MKRYPTLTTLTLVHSFLGILVTAVWVAPAVARVTFHSGPTGSSTEMAYHNIVLKDLNFE